jgi:hypothetical protein
MSLGALFASARGQTTEIPEAAPRDDFVAHVPTGTARVPGGIENVTIYSECSARIAMTIARQRLWRLAESPDGTIGA